MITDFLYVSVALFLQSNILFLTSRFESPVRVIFASAFNSIRYLFISLFEFNILSFTMSVALSRFIPYGT